MIRNMDPSWDSFAEFAKIIRQCQHEAPDTQLLGPLPPLTWHRLSDPFHSSSTVQSAISALIRSSQRGNNKFPNLIPSEIRHRIQLLQSILGVTADVHFHSSKLFSLTSPHSP
jgi:hypothetical protein